MLQSSTPCLSLLCSYLSCFYSQNTAAHFKAFFPFLFFFWSQAEPLLIFSLNQTKNILQFFSFNSHVSESSQNMTCHLPLSTCARYLSLLHSGNKDAPHKDHFWWKWRWLFATPWTVAYQAPPSMGFAREEYWSIQFPSPMHESEKWISRGSSQPRDRTWVSHIAGSCFSLWATREALLLVT